MNYTIQSNKITFSNGYNIDFEFPIKTTLVVNEVIIIIVDPPSNVIYNHNVFAISLTGDFLWRIGPAKMYYWGSDNCPYIQLIINDKDELVLFNWCDTAVIVDPQTAEVIRTYQTK